MVQRRCPACAGVGDCPECFGKGKINTGLYKGVTVDCGACGKSGKCPECGGRGSVRMGPDPDSLFGVLGKQRDAVFQLESLAASKIRILKARGIDPAEKRYGWLREHHCVWADSNGRIIGRTMTEITEESSLWDILTEAMGRRQAVLDYLEALAKENP